MPPVADADRSHTMNLPGPHVNIIQPLLFRDNWTPEMFSILFSWIRAWPAPPYIPQLIQGQEPSTVGITEQKMNEIVNAVGSSYKTMKDLGFALGFQKVDIDQYEASNHQDGRVSDRGITDMMFDWKKKTSPTNQMTLLRQALIKAELREIADTHLPENVTMTPDERAVYTTLQTSTQTSYVGLNTAPIPTGQKQSVELLCQKCDRVIATITNVTNTKRSEQAKKSKVRNIMGSKCVVQLIGAMYLNGTFDTRYDVITLTDADVRISDMVFQWSGYGGYKEHRCTMCKGCSQQVGWYNTPADGSSAAPFHALWLQCLMHDSYDSDNSLNVFFATNKTED